MADSLPYLSGLDLSITLGEEAVNLGPQLIDTNLRLRPVHVGHVIPALTCAGRILSSVRGSALRAGA